MKVLNRIGAYVLFMKRVFSKPERKRVYTKELVNELEKLGLNSVVLVMIISFSSGPSSRCRRPTTCPVPFCPAT